MPTARERFCSGGEALREGPDGEKRMPGGWKRDPSAGRDLPGLG
jgi:hypothetical protein